MNTTTPMDTPPTRIRPDPATEASDRLSRWETFTFAAAHSGVSLLYRVLSLRGLYRFGQWFGTVEWLINYKRRRRFAASLREVLGREPSAGERRRATLDFFRRSRCDKLFYLIFDRIPRDVALDLLSIGNQQRLDEAVTRGRGVYIALSHHGPHHVAAMLMALRGYKVAGVRDRREGGLRRYIQDRCDRLHPEFRRMRVIFADGYPRDIYRCFSEGYLVGSAMDVSRVRHPNQKIEEVTMFGEPRSFLTGPLRVAIRCRAPVLQAFIIPQADFRYRLEITASLVDPDVEAGEAETYAQAVRSYAENVEAHVRRSPALLTRL